ncbi:MAG: gfo/Idh/MocA family oxidoreductase, partial [Verrucomicrobia bacterium]
ARTGSFTTAGLLWSGATVLGANRRLRVAVMGVHGRGTALARGFARLGDVHVAAVCDPDPRTWAGAIRAVGDQQPPPRAIEDFRRLLDDASIDALVIAAPNHWHGPATLLACAAGKHVYVEKPACHNPAEGEWMIEAARRHRRVVQVGTQRRSTPAIREAMARLREGDLGRITFARAWYNNRRGPIGRGRQAPVPAWLNWELWQGPAPRRPYRDNLVHYNWHWFWHWGNGELGNNGIHALDLCRWGLGVDFPHRVVSEGGRYAYDDDQQTPDTQTATFDFGNAAILWEGQSCRRHGYEGLSFGAAFYGEHGTLVIRNGGYTIHDPNDRLITEVRGGVEDAPHLRDFVEAIRENRAPHADIAEGHRSTLLCHLGNIAWRLGRTLRCDPANGHILGDPEAARFWQREYEPGWAPPIG